MVTHNVFFAKHLLALAKICTRISQCPGNVYQKAVRKTLQRFTGKCRRWNPSLFKSQLNNFSLQYEKTSSKILPDQFSGRHHLTDLLNLQSLDKKLFIYFQLIFSANAEKTIIFAIIICLLLNIRCSLMTARLIYHGIYSKYLCYPRI